MSQSIYYLEGYIARHMAPGVGVAGKTSTTENTLTQSVRASALYAGERELATMRSHSAPSTLPESVSSCEYGVCSAEAAEHGVSKNSARRKLTQSGTTPRTSMLTCRLQNGLWTAPHTPGQDLECQT